MNKNTFYIPVLELADIKDEKFKKVLLYALQPVNGEGDTYYPRSFNYYIHKDKRLSEFINWDNLLTFLIEDNHRLFRNIDNSYDFINRKANEYLAKGYNVWEISTTVIPVTFKVEGSNMKLSIIGAEEDWNIL